MDPDLAAAERGLIAVGIEARGGPAEDLRPAGPAYM